MPVARAGREPYAGAAHPPSAPSSVWPPWSSSPPPPPFPPSRDVTAAPSFSHSRSSAPPSTSPSRGSALSHSPKGFAPTPNTGRRTRAPSPSSRCLPGILWAHAQPRPPWSSASSPTRPGADSPSSGPFCGSSARACSCHPRFIPGTCSGCFRWPRYAATDPSSCSAASCSSLIGALRPTRPTVSGFSLPGAEWPSGSPCGCCWL